MERQQRTTHKKDIIFYRVVPELEKSRYTA